MDRKGIAGRVQGKGGGCVGQSDGEGLSGWGEGKAFRRWGHGETLRVWMRRDAESRDMKL